MTSWARRTLWGVLAVVVALGLAWGGIVAWTLYMKAPLPTEDRCVAVAGGNSVSVDPEQAYYASIIAGVALARDLPPRAISIALATAYQESGIRNLDYGHADSLGLFQQRPSKGWGTESQILDPYYSSGAFYDALVRIKNWQTKDINDVAQAVQRSAYPQAYRRHVTNARTLASSLSGQTPASLSCVVLKPVPGDPAGLGKLLSTNLRGLVTITRDPGGLTVSAASNRLAWAAAEMAIAGTARYGVAKVTVGGRSWTHERTSVAAWSGGSDQGAKTLTVAFES